MAWSHRPIPIARLPTAVIVLRIAIWSLMSVPAFSAADPSVNIDVVFHGSELKEDQEDLEPGTGTLPPRYALVIGIDKYRSNAVGLGQLNQPSLDSTKVSKALQDAGFEVTELTTDHGQITRNDFLNAVEQFKEGQPAQHNLGVCYADGRGVPRDDREAARLFNLAADQGLKRGAVQSRALLQKWPRRAAQR